jgi:hypothetical protein
LLSDDEDIHSITEPVTVEILSSRGCIAFSIARSHRQIGKTIPFATGSSKLMIAAVLFAGTAPFGRARRKRFPQYGCRRVRLRG